MGRSSGQRAAQGLRRLHPAGARRARRDQGALPCALGVRRAADWTRPDGERARRNGADPAALRMSAVLKVRVWRGGARGAYREYEVPRRESQTVLDVVTHIQRALDPTLAYRYACRVGMCGSCAMTVNGAPRWTCRPHVAKVARDARLGLPPLRNLPVIRDLVADMREFFDKWARAQGQFKGGRTRADDFERIAPEAEARRRAEVPLE